MRNLFFCLFVFLAASVGSAAQEPWVQEDSTDMYRVHYLDSALVGMGLSSVMPDNVKVERSADIDAALRAHIEANSEKQFSGFRIRIFFDNGQNARKASEAVLHKFKSGHPDVAAQRTFVSPYFKVTVGEYRTRSEAIAALHSYQSEFPSAFIVRESFRYPAL